MEQITAEERSFLRALVDERQGAGLAQQQAQARVLVAQYGWEQFVKELAERYGIRQGVDDISMDGTIIRGEPAPDVLNRTQRRALKRHLKSVAPEGPEVP